MREQIKGNIEHSPLPDEKIMYTHKELNNSRADLLVGEAMKSTLETLCKIVEDYEESEREKSINFLNELNEELFNFMICESLDLHITKIAPFLVNTDPLNFLDEIISKLTSINYNWSNKRVTTSIIELTANKIQNTENIQDIVEYINKNFNYILYI